MVESLQPTQLRTYLALVEAVSLLQYAVRGQLRSAGGLSYVQFEILAVLSDADRPLTMTDLADVVVYSRSGLTHQAGLLEQAELITRHTSPEDQRVTVVSITDAGRARVAAVLPGHIDVVHTMLFESLSDHDVVALGDIMSRARDYMRTQPRRSVASRKPRSAGLLGRESPEVQAGDLLTDS